MRDKIRRQILDAETRNKYCKKKTLLQQVKNNIASLKIGLITKLVLYRKIIKKTNHQEKRNKMEQHT